VGLYTETRIEYTLAVDTDSYSGNFERELFSFIFGLPDTPGEGTRDLSYYTKAVEIAEVSEKMPEDFENTLLAVRMHDPGDDGYHHAYVSICPTPGFFNDGHGVHYEDNEKNRRKVGPTRFPAFQSVAIFLQRAPTDEEMKFIKSRVEAFLTYPKEHEWVTRPKILGYRLLTATTTWAAKEL
jgi:hypothetical protein